MNYELSFIFEIELCVLCGEKIFHRRERGDSRVDLKPQINVVADSCFSWLLISTEVQNEYNSYLNSNDELNLFSLNTRN